MPTTATTASKNGTKRGIFSTVSAADIRRTFEFFHSPGSVFEARVLKIPGRGKPFNAAGYFDDFDQAAVAIATQDRRGPAGIYVIMNPCDPALLARSPNMVTDFLEPTTSDHDILSRRWLLIDLDPKRPAGISATDSEREAAGEMALQVRDWLASLGWPSPALASSGNGWHLLFRVDLPNDAESTAIVKSILEAVGAWVDRQEGDGPRIDVDQAVWNASRICRLYGTTARKGHSTADRPHRVSELVEVPEPVEIVAIDRLQAVAAMTPKAESASSPSNHNGNGDFSRLDVPRWLAARGVKFSTKDRKDSRGRTVYLLEECPFDKGHGRAW